MTWDLGPSLLMKDYPSEVLRLNISKKAYQQSKVPKQIIPASSNHSQDVGIQSVIQIGSSPEKHTHKSENLTTRFEMKIKGNRNQWLLFARQIFQCYCVALKSCPPHSQPFHENWLPRRFAILFLTVITLCAVQAWLVEPQVQRANNWDENRFQGLWLVVSVFARAAISCPMCFLREHKLLLFVSFEKLFLLPLYYNKYKRSCFLFFFNLTYLNHATIQQHHRLHPPLF